MGLHQFKPMPSGRMGTLWTLASIKEAVLVEFGCMGHMLYAKKALKRSGLAQGCEMVSTHIDETDIALGGIARIRNTLKNIAQTKSTKVVFLLPSSVPEIIGTDLMAICEEMAYDYPNLRLLPFGYGGFDVSQHKGIEQTLLLLAKTLPIDCEKTQEATFNIIGSCADLFHFQSDAAELKRIMKNAFGMSPICVMTSDTSVSQLERVGSAHINLVIRREGLQAAKELNRRFGTPYVVGRPYGLEGTLKWIEALAQTLDVMPNQNFIASERKEVSQLMSPAVLTFRHLRDHHPEVCQLSIGAHADVVEGILNYGCDELGLGRGLCWCDCPEMANGHIPYLAERQLMEVLSSNSRALCMTNGEALAWAGKNQALQISNPDDHWRINPYVSPFVGFHGALHIAELLVNEALRETT